MNASTSLSPAGELALKITRKMPVDPTDPTLVAEGPGLLWRLGNIRNYLWMFWYALGDIFARVFGLAVLKSKLYLVKVAADGTITNYGLVSVRKFTQAGGTWIVDSWKGSQTLANMKYHAFGTGNTAESNTDTTLVTEITPATHYTGSVRPSATAVTGASGWIVRLQATHTQAVAGDAIVEHGIVSTSSGAYSLLDRSVFSVINLAIGDSLQATYDLTLTPEA